jgi:hypothetical protein
LIAEGADEFEETLVVEVREDTQVEIAVVIQEACAPRRDGVLGDALHDAVGALELEQVHVLVGGT